VRHDSILGRVGQHVVHGPPHVRAARCAKGRIGRQLGIVERPDEAVEKALAEVMGCPVIQTSGGTAFIKGLEDRTYPYLFSSVGNEIVRQSDLCLAIGTELGDAQSGHSKSGPVLGAIEPTVLG